MFLYKNTPTNDHSISQQQNHENLICQTEYYTNVSLLLWLVNVLLKSLHSVIKCNSSSNFVLGIVCFNVNDGTRIRICIFLALLVFLVRLSRTLATILRILLAYIPTTYRKAYLCLR